MPTTLPSQEPKYSGNENQVYDSCYFGLTPSASPLTYVRKMIYRFVSCPHFEIRLFEFRFLARKCTRIVLSLYICSSTYTVQNCGYFLVGKLQWLGKSHKVFRDNQGDIVTSVHHQRPIKREQSLMKRTKAPSQKGIYCQFCSIFQYFFGPRYRITM